MKPYNGFESKKSGGNHEPLPAGGYVAKILNVEEVSYQWGSVLLLSFDILEGAFKDFFGKDYRSQDLEDKKWRGTYRLRVPLDDGSEKDGWTKRTFGNAIWSVENSNPGYHWDWNEQGLKGKIVGVLFRNKEWEMNGNTGWTTECCALTSVEDIRNGKFRQPKDKPLKNKPVSETGTFYDVKDDGPLPF